MIRKVKGTMDILPDQTPLFRYIEGVMREEAEKYGFGEIRTPTFENTELFVRGVGDTTDVVQKEMYTFADRDENRSISLRPEGTASVVRALIENGKCSDPMPLKYYYIISCFRHEKPQAGRSREFFQFGTETFGNFGNIHDDFRTDDFGAPVKHKRCFRFGGMVISFIKHVVPCRRKIPNLRQKDHRIGK